MSARSLGQPAQGRRDGSRLWIHRPGGSFLEPAYVHVVRGGEVVVDVPAFDDGRQGAVVAPPVNFRMPIGEREATGQMMVVAGQIVKAIAPGLVGPTGHARGKVAHVNAVLAHVEKDESVRRPGVVKFGLFQINLVGAENGTPVAVRAAPAAEEYVHGNAAHAGLELAADHHARAVGGTLPNTEVLTAVRPHGAFLDGQVRIPVGGIGPGRIERAGDPGVVGRPKLVPVE